MAKFLKSQPYVTRTDWACSIGCHRDVVDGNAAVCWGYDTSSWHQLPVVAVVAVGNRHHYSLPILLRDTRLAHLSWSGAGRLVWLGP
ncbi:hypothetical protein Pyn_38725 [Prunus yedoensis var. nudiflora]|uniref:Uncharacterized protein n=1 Tax=Prunus yedoensis var. nudiflora TaxID=2094558 RepID=A0A314UYL3_PRUYE|nr:hypothetical protein Pyn_38725 [Prunus yedoensis var. nudiflora]